MSKKLKPQGARTKKDSKESTKAPGSVSPKKTGNKSSKTGKPDTSSSNKKLTKPGVSQKSTTMRAGSGSAKDAVLVLKKSVPKASGVQTAERRRTSSEESSGQSKPRRSEKPVIRTAVEEAAITEEMEKLKDWMKKEKKKGSEGTENGPTKKRIVYKLTRPRTVYESEDERRDAKPMPVQLREREGPSTGVTVAVSRDKLDALNEGFHEEMESEDGNKKMGQPQEEKEGEGRKRGERETDMDEGGTAATQHIGPNPPETAIVSSASTTLAFEQKKRLPVFAPPTQLTDEEIRRANLVPGLHCSVCSIGVECPEFQEGFTCAYNKSFQAFPSRDADTVIAGMKYVLDKNKERLMRAFHYEEAVNGGQMDLNVTRQSEAVLRMGHGLLELDREVNRVSLTMSDTDTGGGGERVPGILSRLFSPPQPTVTAQLSLSNPSPEPIIASLSSGAGNMSIQGNLFEARPSNPSSRVSSHVPQQPKAYVSDGDDWKAQEEKYADEFAGMPGLEDVEREQEAPMAGVLEGVKEGELSGPVG